MLKKYFQSVIAIAVLIVILITTAIMLPWDRFKKAENLIIDDDVQRTSGIYLFGVSQAPYQQGDVTFYATEKGNYRYKIYGKDGTPETVEKGFDASSWTKIESNQMIKGTDCRNITIVSTDKKGKVKEKVHFNYVPGVIYGYSNPNQYDDMLLYNKENPFLEDERAIKLASNLFESSLTSYAQNDYGSIIQGFLSKYNYVGGLLEGYYHTGTDFTIFKEQPFYSVIDGRITYANATDDYNMIIIYCEEQDMSVIILHANDITPAKEIYQNGGEVKKGDLLGYGGGKGEPAGDMHIHLEVRHGKADKYKSFSKEIQYTRMSNYDPLILADMFNLEVLKEDGFTPFSKVKATGFDAQNNASVVLNGQWLYYIDKNAGNQIYKARPDGTEATLLVNKPCANLNYYEGWLYYSDLSRAGHLVKTKADGSETVHITSVDTRSFVLVQDEWIYFANNLDKNSIFRIKHDGTERKEIADRDVSHIFYYDNAIYYTQNARINSERIYKLDLETLKITQIVESRGDRPFVYNGDICFRRYYSNKNCIRFSLSTLDEASATALIPQPYNQIQLGTRYLIFTRENDADSIYIKFDDKDQPVKLTNDTLCQNLTVQGGWLYYYTPTVEGNVLTRINVYSLKKQRFNLEGWAAVEFDAEYGFEGIILASRTKTAYPTPTPTPVPSVTELPSGSPSVTPTPTVIPSGAPTPNQTPVPSVSPQVTTPASTDSPQNTQTPESTPIPTDAPSNEPTLMPEVTPTQAPTEAPTEIPSGTPVTT